MSVRGRFEGAPAVIQCAFWIILSGFLTVMQLAVVRHISNDVHIFEIVFFRSLIGMLLLSPLIVTQPSIHLRPKRPGLNILCGLIAFCAAVCFYFAAKHMPIADITAIHFVRPIFASIVAAIVLGEALSGNRIAALVLGVAGAAIIIRPGLIDINIGVFYVFGVIAAQSWNPINRKLLSKSEHPDTVAVWNMLTIFPVSAVAAYFVWTTPTLVLVGWMAAIALFEALNQRVLGRAYIQGDAIVVVLLHYTRLPIAALVGFLMFSDVPEIWIWIGAGVIALGAVVLAQGEMRAVKAADKPASKA